MSFAGMLKRKWKPITIVILLSLLFIILVGMVTAKGQMKALQELVVKCDVQFGKNNYAIGTCDAGFCCAENKTNKKYFKTLIIDSIVHPNGSITELNRSYNNEVTI